VRRQVSDLLFQRGIFRLQRGNRCVQLVNDLHGFFQGGWHGVSIPQFCPPSVNRYLVAMRLTKPALACYILRVF
jgi:hypothetical protein